MTLFHLIFLSILLPFSIRSVHTPHYKKVNHYLALSQRTLLSLFLLLVVLLFYMHFTTLFTIKFHALFKLTMKTAFSLFLLVLPLNQKNCQILLLYDLLYTSLVNSCDLQIISPCTPRQTRKRDQRKQQSL